MDARLVALFLFFSLSTGYRLGKGDANDDILDQLQETEALKEVPEMVSCCCCCALFCFLFSAAAAATTTTTSVPATSDNEN